MNMYYYSIHFIILVSSILNRMQGQAMAQRISGQPLIVEGCVQFQPHQCGIFGSLSGTDTVFSQSTAILLHLYHSAYAPFSFIHSSDTNVIQEGFLLHNFFLCNFNMI